MFFEEFQLKEKHELMPSFEARFPNKIEGILGSIEQTFDGKMLFSTIEDCAVAYFVKIATQHPFPDGNKRMAVYLADAFLLLNDVQLNLDWKQMYELAKFVVQMKEQGESADVLEKVVKEVFRKGFSKQ